jgi:hypothetical protein
VTQLLDELRDARPAAPGELRARVRAIAAEESTPARRWLPRRRLALGAAAVALSGMAAAGVVVGLTRTQESQSTVSHGQLVLGAPTHAASPSDVLAPKTFSAEGSSRQRALGPAVFPPSTTRFQNYSASLRLEVANPRLLSDRTKQVMRIARSLGGFVASVDFRSGARSGGATLVLRIPTARVPDAIERLSGLGRILAQHVAIVDVQRRIDALRKRVEQATGDARAAAQRELQRELRAARLSTVAVALTTPAVVPARPHHESRLVQVLELEGQIALYALVIGGPIVLLLALLWLGARTVRRRSEQRLLGA